MRIQLKEGALELEGWENAGSTQMAIAAHVSSAISLKRIADVLEAIHKRRELTNICDAITDVSKQIKGARND